LGKKGEGEGENEENVAWRILVENPEVKRPLRRQVCRWVDNIKMDIKEMRYDSILDSSGLRKILMMGSCEGGLVPRDSLYSFLLEVQ
jgi:hypothetical protein